MTALPPGPRGALRQSLGYSSDPYTYSSRCARRYGDVFTVPMLNGPIVVCGHPDAARALFTAPVEDFDIWSREQLVAVFGADSIFTVTDEGHRRHRRAVVAAVRHRGAMEAICRARVEALRAQEELSVARFALDLSMDIILDVVFGARGDEVLASLLHRYVDVAGSDALLAALVVPSLRRRLYPPWASFSRLHASLRERLSALVARRRAEPGTPGAAGDALGELVAHLDDRAAADDLITLLIAGHETTARAIAWALDSLHHVPAVLARLQAEIDAWPADTGLEAIAALPYLDAVCEETLRLHPVVVQVTRTLRRPRVILGHALPAGTSVAASAYLIHRRPELYPAPESFRPERFLERAHGPFEDLPFGGGPTRCPGAAFAKDEMKLALFHLLRRFALRPRASRPARAVVRGLVMAPEGELRMTLAPRGSLP